MMMTTMMTNGEYRDISALLQNVPEIK